MINKLLEGIYWVKIVYPDSSTRIFRGTKNVEICKDRGFTKVSVGEILDVGKSQLVYVPPECELSVHDLKPEYERRVDEFASRFI